MDPFSVAYGVLFAIVCVGILVALYYYLRIPR
jgi:tetrahydromethanopterin S-methyltransferase subunit F